METPFSTSVCFVVILATCLNAAVVEGTAQHGAWPTMMPAAPAQYKVVTAVPAPVHYKVVAPAPQPRMKVVRPVVAGCSITSCSQVVDGCGWCEKHGGYAVGYDKKEELIADKKRTTLTLRRECKGLFIFDASKCPSAKATASPVTPLPIIAPKATGAGHVIPPVTPTTTVKMGYHG